jgi:hypothetical protein
MMMEPPPVRRIAGTAYFTDRNTPSRFLRVLKRATISGVVPTGWHSSDRCCRICCPEHPPPRRSLAVRRAAVDGLAGDKVTIAAEQKQAGKGDPVCRAITA